MKKTVHVSPETFARIQERALFDELHGIDPGARWAQIYPDATELEFVVIFQNDEVPAP